MAHRQGLPGAETLPARSKVLGGGSKGTLPRRLSTGRKACAVGARIAGDPALIARDAGTYSHTIRLMQGFPKSFP